MTGPLSGMTIVECGAFIAGPFATQSLAALGAEVIRIDLPDGPLDGRRWPLSPAGRSIYWAGLNRGKKSVAIDFRTAEGRAIATELICAPGDDCGYFVTNFPARGWLDPATLAARRRDLIMINIVGNHDGSTALDYTVNCGVGFPDATGPADDHRPVNHVLPAWDFICGQTAATALLAADRRRRIGGEGDLVRIALSDVALNVAATLGLTGEVELTGRGRPRYGNDLYGAYGHDFATADGRRVMVAAVSGAQWTALVSATSAGPALAELAASLSLDLTEEGARFEARDRITEICAPWFAARTLAEITDALDAAGACWGPYQSFAQLVGEDRRFSETNPMFARVTHPGIGSLLTPGSPARFSAASVPRAAGASIPGSDTFAVLKGRGFAEEMLRDLHARGIIGGGQ